MPEVTHVRAKTSPAPKTARLSSPETVGLPSTKSQSTVTEVLTTRQVTALAGAVPARYRAVILAGAGLGLRPGELFGLTLDRVEFLKRRVRVEQHSSGCVARAYSSDP